MVEADNQMLKKHSPHYMTASGTTNIQIDTDSCENVIYPKRTARETAKVPHTETEQIRNTYTKAHNSVSSD